MTNWKIHLPLFYIDLDNDLPRSLGFDNIDNIIPVNSGVILKVELWYCNLMARVLLRVVHSFFGCLFNRGFFPPAPPQEVKCVLFIAKTIFQVRV